MTYALAIICILLYRIRYLQGYIRGQRIVAKTQAQVIEHRGEVIDQYADLVDRQREQLDNFMEVVISQNEQIKDLQFDPQEFVDDILKDKK